MALSQISLILCEIIPWLKKLVFELVFTYFFKKLDYIWEFQLSGVKTGSGTMNWFIAALLVEDNIEGS